MNIADSHTATQVVSKVGESAVDPFSRRPTAPSILVVRTQKMKETEPKAEPPQIEEKKPEAPAGNGNTKPKDNKKPLKIRPETEKKDEEDSASLLQVHDTLHIDLDGSPRPRPSPVHSPRPTPTAQPATSVTPSSANTISLADYNRRRGLN